MISEYELTPNIFASNFIARNRLIAGLSQVLVITEAAEKSGSLHTARFALEQGKDVAAVPGSIFSTTSAGANNLLKAGAKPVTSYTDILHLLKLTDTAASAVPTGSTPAEQLILDLLGQGIRDSDVLLASSGLDIAPFNQALTMLEISGSIRSMGGEQWGLR